SARSSSPSWPRRSLLYVLLGAADAPMCRSSGRMQGRPITRRSHCRGLAARARGTRASIFPFAQKALEAIESPRCPVGGTGRRARLKIVFRKEWGFDSLHGHHLNLITIYYQEPTKNDALTP